jgi:hypothetical protein
METIREAMDLPPSTHYSQLEKGTLIKGSVNYCGRITKAATNLGTNRAELLTCYRPSTRRDEIPGKEDGGPPPLSFPRRGDTAGGNDHGEAGEDFPIATT